MTNTNDKEKIRYSKAVLNDYRRDSSLLKRKLIAYLPAMMMTNLSNLLLVSVDGVVVGNFVGSDAFASVNIFGNSIVFVPLSLSNRE